MRLPIAASLFVLFLLTLASCTRAPTVKAIDTYGDGRPDAWVYRIGESEVKVALDTNGDGHAGVVSTF